MEKNQEEQLKKEHARKEEEFENSLAARIAKAIDRLRKLGMKETIHTNGARAIYLPGNVNLRNIMDVKTYGMHIAANTRTHKHYLRHRKN